MRIQINQGQERSEISQFFGTLNQSHAGILVQNISNPGILFYVK